MSYRPVSCALHSELELAIMRRTPLTLCWKDAEGAKQQATIRPTDLVTRKEGEFLQGLTEAEQPLELRLDQLIDAP